MDSKRILIVDDAPGVRETLKYIFERHLSDCRLTVAADGADALAAFQQQPFDLVLTDYQMPRMDGLALVQAIRRNWPNTRIVLMSGSLEADQAGQAIDQLALDGYLAKPFRLKELLATVEQLMDGTTFKNGR